MNKLIQVVLFEVSSSRAYPREYPDEVTPNALSIVECSTLWYILFWQTSALTPSCQCCYGDEDPIQLQHTPSEDG